jgi:hypothetical protein
MQTSYFVNRYSYKVSKFVDFKRIYQYILNLVIIPPISVIPTSINIKNPVKKNKEH